MNKKIIYKVYLPIILFCCYFIFIAVDNFFIIEELKNNGKYSIGKIVGVEMRTKTSTKFKFVFRDSTGDKEGYFTMTFLEKKPQIGGKFLVIYNHKNYYLFTDIPLPNSIENKSDINKYIPLEPKISILKI